jgi:NAD(P)-dependent dehydrogenase (short-subunit alcohol dehydrogenase family)/very-short-patch-repair endonuclease
MNKAQNRTNLRSPLAGEQAKRIALSRGGKVRVVKNARNLRNNLTDAEKKLWHALKSNQLGVKFRRQQPIDNYIADFACLEKKLIIELDGGQHGEQTVRDETRTQYIKQFGFRVLRFWNNEVLQNLNDVLETIRNALSPPTLTLPRKGGGKEIPNLSDKIALVTGASRGIGFASALGMAKAGAHIVALARTTGGLQELDDKIFAETGKRATLVPVDITDYDVLDRLGAALFERFKRLDILLANAAYLHPLSPLGHIAPKDFEQTIAVNLTANWRLIRAIDPLLRAAPNGLAIFVTDNIAHEARPFWGAYAASKAAFEVLAKTYAAEVEHTNIRVEFFHPGPTQTRLRKQAFPGAEEAKMPFPEAIYEVIRSC